MKVWRVITLVLWSLFLAGLLAVSTSYLLAYQTVLNEQAVTTQLTKDEFIASFRNEVVIPKAQSVIKANMTPNALLSDETIKTALENSFTLEKTREIIAASLPSIYAWLDKKSPDISISIPIETELNTFRQAINDEVGAKLKALPECKFWDVPPEVVTRLECMPQYTSAGTVVSEVMTEVDDALASAPTELTAETFGLTAKQLGPGINVPDYLSYLWALNLITTPLAALTILYLILRRRAAGLLAVGIVLFMLGGVLLAGSIAIGLGSLSGSALQQSLTDLTTALLSDRMRYWGFIGAGSGLAMIILAVIWIRKRRPKVKDHYAATRSED